MIASLTVGIGCFEDSETIEDVVDEALRLKESIDIPVEVLVIDDGSRDESVDRLRKLEQKNPDLRVIVHDGNRGYAATLRELFREARHDALFTCPGDGQIRPGVVRDLWPALSDADIVIGVRTPRRDPLRRRFQSGCYRSILRLFFGLKSSDPNSSKLLRTSLLRKLSLNSKSAFVEAELLLSLIHISEPTRPY